jgi:transposase
MSFIRKICRGGKTYLAEVENRRIDGKVAQRHIRYVGRQADDRVVLASSISDASIDSVKLYGPLIVLDHLAKEIGLSSLLGKYGNEILSLVYAHCIDYKSVNQMTRWFERSDLSMILDLEKLTEARLLAALDSLEANDPIALQKKIFKSVSARYNLDSKGVVYDVTNTYLYGRKCPFAKPGKDKEGVKGRPLIQIGLGATQRDGIPVFYKVYNGNTHDSKTFQDAITSFGQYGFKDGLIVFDRGISSEPNQREIKRMGWKVLCGLPLTSTLKKIARRISSDKDFASYKNRVKLNGNVFYSVAMPYEIAGVKGKIAICFNEQRKREVKESRYDEIFNAEILLKNRKRIKSGLEKYFDRKGNLDGKRLKESEEMDGYSIIFSTDELTERQMIELYFAKDLVEKAFHCLKGTVKVRPVRHWLYNRVIAHVFICYLAYLLLSLLKLRLKPLEMSPVECLTELNSLYKVYIRDDTKGFKLSKIVSLSKKQEEILKTVDKKLIKMV